MKKITILLVDDHRLLRESWTGILNADSRFHVIADTGNGAEAIEMLKNLQPAIVLLDINMIPVDGFEVTRHICRNKSQSRIIGLSMYRDIISVKRLLAIGAMGYLTKNSSKEEMMLAITEVNNGNRYICEDVKNILAHREIEDDKNVLLFNTLTEREIEIVQQVKKGFSSREIALMLDIRQKTVEVHRSNILRKLKLKNCASLVNYFNVNGL
jgi:DNA-binding NarL/FixJ family response regulator